MIRLIVGILLFGLGLYVVDLNFSASTAVIGSIIIFISVGIIGLGMVTIHNRRKKGRGN